MKKYSAYFDGGQYFLNKGISKRDQLVHNTYGILVHIGKEEPLELYGQDILPIKYQGLHEYIAFIKCYEFLKNQNINIKNVVFHTDCENLAYASMYLHEQNYMTTKKESLLLHIKKSLEAINMYSIYDEIIECLKNANFNKIKSHENCVDNTRVDYLAKTAHKGKEKISYQKFLTCAFSDYNKDGFFFYNLPFMPTFNKIKIQR